MTKIEVLNFQNLLIQNAKVKRGPLKQIKFEDDDTLKVVIIRNPYEYFDYLMFDLLQHKKSILFTHDIIKHMKRADSEAFLQWFDTLNCIPFYNPQTYQLDIRKRISIAIENLENFDYVVPYEEVDLFLENVDSDIIIKNGEVKKLVFSFESQRGNKLVEKFIGKDIKLYQKSQELWRLSKENSFKPLGSLIERKVSLNNIQRETKPDGMKKYKGIAGRISESLIAGWVFHMEKQEIIEVAIYNNGEFLCTVKADKERVDLRKQNIHPTGQCGFEVVFDKSTFKKGDKVEVKILPEEILLPLGKIVKEFLGL